MVWSLNIHAQSIDSTYKINLIGSYFKKDTRISLRWVPSSPGFWTLSNYYGYHLERAELDTLSNKPLAWQSLGILKPLSLDQWKTKVREHPTDTMLMVAGQAIHGERTINSFDMASLVKQSDQLQNLYSACVLAAEFSKEAAIASALRFEDPGVAKNKYYFYKLTLNLPDTAAYKPIATVIVNTVEEEKYPDITVTEIIEGEKRVEFLWDRNYYKNYYSAFNIYKSADGKNFVKLNGRPVSYIAYKDDSKYTYRDSLESNYVENYYKIEGITAFGDAIPASNIIKAQGRDRTRPEAPFNIKTQSLGGRRMEITWQVNPADTDIAGFRISRSNEIDKGFIELTKSPLPPAARSFIDTTANELLNNYYFIGVFDHENNVNVSMPKHGTIIDSIPPAAPYGLTGSIDTSGIVTLRWRLGMEPDLKGYFVHYSDRPNDTFKNRCGHPVQDTVWRDTIPLNVLSEEIFYKVVAIDHRFNYSGYSLPIKLKKPDKIKPASPVFITCEVKVEGIELKWYNSSSHDVKKNVLSRRKKGDQDFKTLMEFNGKEMMSQYLDKQLEPGVEYEYQLQAIDDAGLKSDIISSLRAKSYINKTLKAVEKVGISIDTIQKTYTLNWTYDNYADFKFVIFRSVNDGPYVNYKAVKGALLFTDQYYSDRDQIKFKIQAVNSKGWLSDFSNEIVMPIPR